MKFEVKTEPVCVGAVTLGVYAAIIEVQVQGNNFNFSEGWYTITVILFILLLLISYTIK
jgi:hypothetical protein